MQLSSMPPNDAEFQKVKIPIESRLPEGAFSEGPLNIWEDREGYEDENKENRQETASGSRNPGDPCS